MTSLTKDVNGYQVYDKNSVLDHNEEAMKNFTGNMRPSFPLENGVSKFTGFMRDSMCGVDVFTGKTYPVREYLKAAGWVYNEVFSVWHPAGTVIATLWP